MACLRLDLTPEHRTDMHELPRTFVHKRVTCLCDVAVCKIFQKISEGWKEEHAKSPAFYRMVFELSIKKTHFDWQFPNLHFIRSTGFRGV